MNPRPPSQTLRPPGGEGPAGSRYLIVLTWAFTLFNSVRMLAYIPTIWAIHASGDASQHSLWTWVIWLGANATMAAWLYEHNARRINRAAIINAGNAMMCAVTAALILVYQLGPS